MDHQYQSLIIFLNRRCPVGCSSCNAGAVPGNPQELSVPWLSSFFPKVKNLKFPGYILWTGGEPFLSFDALKRGISIACAQGYHSEILTSGVWFASHPERLEPLAEIAGKGNVSLRISLDAEHQEKVPLSLVIALIGKALEKQLEVNFTLREIPGSRGFVHRCIEEIKKSLPEYYLRNRSSRWLHYIPHIPISSEPSPPGTPPTQKYRQPCRMIFRDLVVGEDGLVYPCCGFVGFPSRHALAVGDPITETWDTLAYRHRDHPLFRKLKEKGPYGICRESDLEPETWEGAPFQNTCHLCLALLRLAANKLYSPFSESESSKTNEYSPLFS